MEKRGHGFLVYHLVFWENSKFEHDNLRKISKQKYVIMWLGFLPK
jgi:hypothetical protein